IYINGKDDCTNYAFTAATGALSQNDNIKLGVDDFSVSTRSLYGQIDEAAIWNRALSAEEINELYQNFKSLRFQVRSGNALPLLGDFVGPDGTTNSVYKGDNDELISTNGFNVSDIYAQYRAFLYADYYGVSSNSPILEAVSLSSKQGGLENMDNTSQDFMSGFFDQNVRLTVDVDVNAYVGIAKKPVGGYYTNATYVSRIITNPVGSVSWTDIDWIMAGEEIDADQLASDMDGLIGLYHCHNWADASSSGHGGTASPGNYTSMAKLGSGSAVFNGTSDYIHTFNYGATAVKSVEFWINNNNADDSLIEFSAGKYVSISNRMINVSGYLTNQPIVYVNGYATSPK
ncbi:hypothetical protein BVX94_00855, partial [bacterium B17]